MKTWNKIIKKNIRGGNPVKRIRWMTRTFDAYGNKIRRWFFRGMIHRTDGPAVIFSDPSGKIFRQEWWIKDQIHRISAPAVIEVDADGNVYEEWWIKNNLYRKEGPFFYRR